MAFEEIPDFKPDEDSNVVRVFKNTKTLAGVMENAQFLREYSDGTWKLAMRAGFTVFCIPLLKYQARELIEDKFRGIHSYILEVVDDIKDPW